MHCQRGRSADSFTPILLRSHLRILMHRHLSVQELATTAAAQSRELATETAKQTRIAAQSSYKAAAEASKKAEIKLKQLAQDLNSKPGSGQASKEQELEEAGITEELIDFIRGIDIKTFRQFPLEDALCILNDCISETFFQPL